MTPQTDIYETEREKLRELQLVFEKAVEENNIEDIRPFTHPDFSFVSFTDKEFKDFDAFKQQWGITRKQMLGSGRFSTQLNPQPTLFLDDVAIASGNAKNSMVDSKGQHYEFTNHWTVIFKRSNDEWKVLRAHNSLDPFANPMLIHGVKRKLLNLGLFAFIGGALVSSIINYFI